MHSFSNEETNTFFNFNSDLSGDVYINLPAANIEDIPFLTHNGKPMVCIAVSGQDLVDFVVSRLKQHKVSKIENMTVDKFIDSL